MRDYNQTLQPSSSGLSPHTTSLLYKFFYTQIEIFICVYIRTKAGSVLGPRGWAGLLGSPQQRPPQGHPPAARSARPPPAPEPLQLPIPAGSRPPTAAASGPSHPLPLAGAPHASRSTFAPTASSRRPQAAAPTGVRQRPELQGPALSAGDVP